MLNFERVLFKLPGLLLVKFLSIFVLLSNGAWGLEHPDAWYSPSCLIFLICDDVNVSFITMGKVIINQWCTCIVTVFSRLDSLSLQWIISIVHMCLGLIKAQFTVSCAVRSPYVTCRGHREMYSCLREWESSCYIMCVLIKEWKRWDIDREMAETVEAWSDRKHSIK